MNYISEQFVKNDSYRYTLSIRFKTDGFSFMIRDDRQLLRLKELEYSINNDISYFLLQEECLNWDYKKVYLLPEQKEKILIPESFFKPELLSSIYSLSMPLKKEEKIVYNHFPPLHCYIAQSCNTHLVELFKTHYPKAYIISPLYPWFYNILLRTTPDECELFLNINDHYFDMIVLDRREISFFNTFNYDTISDIVYYILNALEQFGIKDVFTTHLCGKLGNDSSILEKYLPNVTYWGMEELMRLCNSNSNEQSYYINQSAIHQCEL